MFGLNSCLGLHVQGIRVKLQHIPDVIALLVHLGFLGFDYLLVFRIFHPHQADTYSPGVMFLDLLTMH